ncbi:MAG: acyl-CoA synthetase [Gemmatimonadales bacterium]
MQLLFTDRAAPHAERVAITSSSRAFTYRELLDASARVAAALLDGETDLQEARVAFLAHPGFDYVAVQWGIWRAGGIAVPLAVSHPTRELAYVIDDCGATTIVVQPDLAAHVAAAVQERSIPLELTSDLLGYECEPADECDLDAERRAMILYTSGTTGEPKGVVTTHGALQSQITTLVSAWGWTPADRTLLTLPLHHVHGIVNVLSCALWVGAECKIIPQFDADRVWTSIREDDLTVFMAVPTIYVKLIDAWERASRGLRAEMSRSAGHMRLMVSGSAALPRDVLERWKRITGHVLLERYGMTEIGMALSNPLEGERVPGHVGFPLPDVEVRLVDESGSPAKPGCQGEIQVKGPGVFKEYWNRPKATAEAFVDGWFATGDIAVEEEGGYRILGRNNVDMIKTGGYKVSALEIENVLQTHEDIAECAVVGVADREWGERVCVAIESSRQQHPSLEALRAWCKKRLAPYKIPTDLIRVEELPRNAMGKVMKPKVVEMFEKGP